MWRPDSLQESLAEGASFVRDRHDRYQCPNCRSFRAAAIIIDVRALPIPEDWACDVCWTHWERTDRVIDGGGAITKDFEWRRRWVTVHGAPANIVNKFRDLALASPSR